MKHPVTTVLVLFLALTGLALTGCKKDNEQGETGGSASPVSVLSAPAEISAQEEMQTLPSAAMKGLSVHTIPTTPTAAEMPDMVHIAGTDMSLRMSQRMKTTQGWTQKFPSLFHHIQNCLAAADGGGAYISNVTETGDEINIEMTGLDNMGYNCRIADSTPTLTETGEATNGSVLFYPREGGRPLVNNPQCYDMEAMVARPQGLIGWLAYHKADCAIEQSVRP